MVFRPEQGKETFRGIREYHEDKDARMVTGCFLLLYLLRRSVELMASSVDDPGTSSSGLRWSSGAVLP